MTGEGAATYAYDPLGRLSRAQAGGSGITYAYDALDRTTSRTETGLIGGASEETAFAYTGASHEIASETTGAGQTLFANVPGGALAQSSSGAVSHLLRDPHGDVVGAHQGGALSWAAAYDPFGVPLEAPSGTLGFQSDPTDPATGLVDMQARLYAPGLGRFTTADPLFGDPAAPLTLNPYAYAVGNPVTLSDPTGLCPPQYCYDEGYHGDEDGNSGHSPESASRLVPPQTAPVLGHDPKPRIVSPKLKILLRITGSHFFDRRVLVRDEKILTSQQQVLYDLRWPLSPDDGIDAVGLASRIRVWPNDYFPFHVQTAYCGNCSVPISEGNILFLRGDRPFGHVGLARIGHVRVTGVSNTGWSFQAMSDHQLAPGGQISFSIGSRARGAPLELRIVARHTGRGLEPSVPGVFREPLARLTWSRMAASIYCEHRQGVFC